MHTGFTMAYQLLLFCKSVYFKYREIGGDAASKDYTPGSPGLSGIHKMNTVTALQIDVY